MNSKQESANLDFLRTIAVVFVVTRHTMQAINYDGNGFFKPQFLGILGVLLFFVHTSLVLMYSLERQREKYGNRLFYATFLIRRIFRIYPLSMVIVTIVFLLSITWKDNPINPTIYLGDFVANLLLIQNLTHSPSVIGPLWSLPIELQMYFFLPILFLFACRMGTRSFIFKIWLTSVIIAFTQFKFPILISDVLKFAPCFIPGIICFTLSGAKRSIPFWFLPVFLVLCVMCYMVLGPISQTIGGYPICLVLGLVLPFIKELDNQILKKLCHTVAKYSYSVYLLHAICLSIVFSYLPNLPVVLLCIVFLGLTCITSFLSYHMIEAPFIKIGNKLVASVHRRKIAHPRSNDVLSF